MGNIIIQIVLAIQLHYGNPNGNYNAQATRIYNDHGYHEIDSIVIIDDDEL